MATNCCDYDDDSDDACGHDYDGGGDIYSGADRYTGDNGTTDDSMLLATAYCCVLRRPSQLEHLLLAAERLTPGGGSTGRTEMAVGRN